MRQVFISEFDGPAISLATRKNNNIRNGQPNPLRIEDMVAGAKHVMSSYPNAVLRCYGSTYNCMGMAFAARRTCVDTSSLKTIMTDDGYRPIPEAELCVGDVVAYSITQNGPVMHVGIVSYIGVVTGNGDHIRVLSKWGTSGPECFHPMRHVPYGFCLRFFTDRIST